VGCNCQYPVCFNLPSYDNSVCNNHGTCIAANSCLCNNGYSGNQCQFILCNNITSNNINVCNGNGNCTAPNKCNCNSYYTDQFCQTTKCFGVSKNDPSVCNSNGVCLDVDTCSCNKGYSGNKCQFNLCNNTISSDTTVCSGYGQCMSPNFCLCQANVKGEYCNLYSCFGVYINDTKNICNGKGICTSLNKCDCHSIFSGVDCSDQSFVFIIAIIVVIVIFFIIIFCCFLIISSCLIISIISLLTINYQKNKKQFLIKNNEFLDRLHLMDNLNKINYNLIKFEKDRGDLVEIGRGASSIVYKGIKIIITIGTYNSKKVAIKQLKTDKFENNMLSEIILLKNLDHPNIIKYYGYSFDKEYFYILTGILLFILELMGGNLSDLVNNQSYSNQQMYQILLDICNGMSFLHSLSTPIIHRGIINLYY
jgi:hypothetical protein